MSDIPVQHRRTRQRTSETQRFTGHLNKYYDQVISYIRDAESILILGPGEAKVELKKRLEREALSGRVVGIETVDKMTDRQIAAKVRQHFPKRNLPNNKIHKIFIGDIMTHADDRQHRSILRSIARRAMLERGLLPDFPPQALAELDGIHGLQPELKQRRGSQTP